MDTLSTKSLKGYGLFYKCHNNQDMCNFIVQLPDVCSEYPIYLIHLKMTLDI